jgi:hypothetical protein
MFNKNVLYGYSVDINNVYAAVGNYAYATFTNDNIACIAIDSSTPSPVPSPVPSPAPGPYYYLSFTFSNGSRCDQSNVVNQIVGYYSFVDGGYMTSTAELTYPTTTFLTNYSIGDVSINESFRDNCINDIYSGNTTNVTITTRNKYDEVFVDPPGEYECASPLNVNSTDRSIPLNALASIIKSQYLADNTKGLSSGNPFVYNLIDS